MKNVDEKVSEFEEMWKKVDGLIEAALPTRPKNSFTAMDLAKRKGITKSQAQKRLYRLVKNGTVKMHQPGPTAYYTLVK